MCSEGGADLECWLGEDVSSLYVSGSKEAPPRQGGA